MQTAPDDPTVTMLTAHLLANAGRYLPDADAITAQARLVRVARRHVSRLYEFDVSVGDRHQPVLVKVPTADAEAARAAARASQPRVRPLRAISPDPAAKAELEHAALQAIYEHFTGIADPRLGAVRVFDYLPDGRAVVMQHVQEPSLRWLVMQPWWAGRRGAATMLPAVFYNVGTWLRRFHALPVQPHVAQRHGDRAEFFEYLSDVARFLGRVLRERAYFGSVVASVAVTVGAVLPGTLPLGRSHGDFAMRNVLVAPTTRVTVLDTLGRFSTAIYEDIGTFLTDLKCNPVLGLGWTSRFGRARVAAFEQAFLAGYFQDEAVPARAIALYEVQSILERWSSLATRRERAAGAPSRLLRATHWLVMSRHFRRLLEDRLRVATGWPTAPVAPRG